ncbi:uncharacterized protein LOC131670866 [Phymastichus coffea]|uniref:uncharacterized protein LOC131670866 n=1 Tax=Phymastichus coffea TaxID=108790 RepID=UPI00273C3E44|nr:uncharacterized protein LOC131670866 [Phymastichus coffea]
MDEETRKRGAIEAGREMLLAYQSKRANKKLSNSSVEPASDEESLFNETVNQSIDLRSISNNESAFSRDVTVSSVSMSEGEGDYDLEGLAGRVTVLKEQLQGKEAVVQALSAEIDHLRTDVSSPTSSHSQSSNIPLCTDLLGTYHTKLQEFERALQHRDDLIEDLTTSLQQALASRDALLAQITILNTSELENTNDNDDHDGKIVALEGVLDTQKELITSLRSKLEQAQEKIEKLETENSTKNNELVSYKDEVENLNKRIKESTSNPEEHLLQKSYDQVKKIEKDMKIIIDKFAAETIANKTEHDSQIKELKTKHEEELKKLTDENKNLEARHAEEMSALQSQLSKYKQTLEPLKLELLTSKQSYIKEKELLTEQIKLHKLQLEEMTTKYVATASVWDSKESIERSLEQALSEAANLRSENESLKFKLDDLSSRYSAAQGLIENGQQYERQLSNKIFTLEKSLSRLSGISFKDLDETTYQTFDDVAVQFQITQQRLEEKAALEKDLLEKIRNFEDLVSKNKIELEIANQEKENYEKQIKDMKNTIDQLKAEMKDQPTRMSTDSLEMMMSREPSFEQKILELKNTIQKRDEETAEYMKKLEELTKANSRLLEESEKLRSGLQTAYAQCAIFEEKLDQTLALGDSTVMLDQTEIQNSTFNLEELLLKQTNYNNVLIKLDSCRKQLQDYEDERARLLKEIEEKSKEKEVILASVQQKEEQHREELNVMKMESEAESQKFEKLLRNFEEGNEGLKQLRDDLEEKHAKEMEELRTYFEQKCLHLEKQYSEEVFSQQSKKMSDNDSELEELTEDLYVGGLGGGGDAEGASIGEAKSESNRTASADGNEKIAQVISKYEEKLEILKIQLNEEREKSGRTMLLKAINQFSQTEQNSSCNNDSSMQESCELNELRADYNRQLEEQVGLARVDIINALREQIEALITMESESDENWPTELLELRNKFTSNTKREIQTLKEKHLHEIRCLKEESNQVINELQEEIRRIRTETHESLQSNLMKERDTLHKTCETLKGLVGQLIDYFVDCEEELNNTLINEILKKQSLTRADSSFENDKVKRVHFAPQSGEIASIISSDSDLQQLINSEKDIMKIMKKDLDACLQRLRVDSARIMNISSSDSESWSIGIGDNQSERLTETEKLLACFQEENEHLKVKIIDLQQRLINAESKKEVISEGYGEQDTTGCDVNEDFMQLQDRARNVVMHGSNDTTYLIQIIDDLCKQGDKKEEDLKKEREDLQHQVSLVLPTPTPNMSELRCSKIEAADKQLRSTRKFQEEQAIERENERDEAAKTIKFLEDQLKEQKERSLRLGNEQCALSPASSTASSSTLRPSDESEVELSSMESVTGQLTKLERQNKELDCELKEAVAKIWELKDIIRDLEQQMLAKTDREDILNNQIQQLEEVIMAQTKNQQDLVQELEIVKSGNENAQLSDHIGHLQEELRKHQLSSEQLTANSSALRQLRMEIRELQTAMDRKTRELESLHVCGSSLSISQPSEDVSIRDQIDAARCPTPDDPTSPPILPLDHVLKLKDTLVKHFRAEDVALKRLKDLEIQLGSLQRQNEELLAEQELMQQTTSEQLFQIETLRARLEQQKQNAPFAQRQVTSRLETQLYEINDRLEVADRALADKNMELNEVKDQLERVTRLLADKEMEIANVVHSESDVMKKLKDRLEIVEEENRLMQTKIHAQDKGQNLPQIIDSMLAEKNAEIDHLKEQLVHREKQLEVYLSIDEAQLRELLRQNETQQKHSARTLSDILSINSECEDACEAIREAPNFTRSQNISLFKLPNSDTLPGKQDIVDFSHPITETPRVPRLELGSAEHSDAEHIESNVETSKEQFFHMEVQPHSEVPLVNITTIHELSSGTHEDSTNSEDSDDVCPRHGKVSNANNSLPHNNETLMYNAQAIQRINGLECHIKVLKQNLQVKTEALEQREAELTEIQNSLEQLQENIESLNEDRLFYKAEYEKSKDNESKIQRDLVEVENTLKDKIEEFEEYKKRYQIDEKILADESRRLKRSEAALQEKLMEVTNLKEIISEKELAIATLQTRNTELEDELKELQDFRRKLDTYKQEIAEYHSEIRRLSEGLNSRDQMIRRLEEMARRSSLSGDSSPSEKDQEIYHLQEYLKEKDKVIRQINDDSKSLHRALETIQNKMKESGNVVELRRKIKDERKRNVELAEENAKLRTEVEMLGHARRPDEDHDITEMVQRELNLSARLDQQLMNVIDSEPDGVLKKCGDLKQANKEIEELTRLKNDLDIEKEMLKSQISEYERRIQELKSDVEEESLKVLKLEEFLSKERHLVRQLQIRMQREKREAEENKDKDTELITMLRIKLNEALEARNRLIDEYKHLEMMNAARKGLPAVNVQEDFKKLQTELTEKLEAEKRKTEEVQDALSKISSEKDRLQSQFEAAKAEIEKLTNNFEIADSTKDQLKADLRKAKEELKARTKECEWQKSLLKTVSDAETKRTQHRTNADAELKNTRRELKNAQEVMLVYLQNDFEADMKTLKLQLNEAAERENQLSLAVASLTDKETELTEKLIAAKAEDKKLRELIAEQQAELKRYLSRELDYADDLRKVRMLYENGSSPSKVWNRVKELNATIENLSKDKMNLYEKVERIREENNRYLEQIRFLESQLAQKMSKPSNINRQDYEERLQHFYGKYLRSESRRKALIYQKHYLYCIVSSYQIVQENTVSFLAALTQAQRVYVRPGPHRKNAKVRFRAAILVVIGLQRMKWLILRWRTGRRVGANVVLGSMDRPVIYQPPTQRAPLIGSGHSPPVKERTINRTSYFSQDPYFRRFTDIQQNLHLQVPESNANTFKKIYVLRRRVAAIVNAPSVSRARKRRATQRSCTHDQRGTVESEAEFLIHNAIRIPQSEVRDRKSGKDLLYTMASSSIVETMRTLKEVSSPQESRILALTSLRRSQLQDDKKIMSLKDGEFCELCNAVIEASLTDDEKLHIEACRTLDIVLPETVNKSFDFFKSILQINRKKRLKLLESLSILKDDTVSVIGNKPSVIDFFNNCFDTAQPKTMEWLRDENADNIVLLKNLENRTLSESDELEEKFVDQALKFLARLCGLSSLGLNVRQFDTFIMEKVVPLAYMGHRKQRTEALNVLQLAIKNDIGLRIKSLHREIWEKYKITLQNFYCKRMLLLVNSSEPDWAALWENSITFIGTDLHRGSGLVNSLLKVEEIAFKSADPNRKQAFLSWKLLIDNFALDQHELATTRRIKLLCTPLNAKNSKTEVMVLTKLEVWWHLIYKVYPSISECVDSVLIPFLNMCFGPFGDKPLFTQKSDSNVSLGKKFPKTQLFAVNALVQLIVDKKNESTAMLSMIQEKLPSPVNSAVFESKYKIFIHCFGEVLLSLSLLPDEEVQNKSLIPKIIWDSLIKRIGEYDKMKVPMYKEIGSVIVELIKNNFHKMALIKNFLLEVVLKNFNSISNYIQFTEQILADLINLYLQVNHFSGFSHENFISIETLLMHLIKPKDSNTYYPKTLEMMQKILQILDDTRKNKSHMYATCEVWCILARIAKKYVEDEQPINESNLIEHKFETIENIIKFPFVSLYTDNRLQLKSMAEAWMELYKQFDLQAELMVTVKPNEILSRTSNMIILALKWEKKCYEFAAVCIDGLLSVVSYNELPGSSEIPPFLILLKSLSVQCLSNKSFATDKVLKAFSSFLLGVFNYSVEKTAVYLKVSEPMVKILLKTQTDDTNLEKEICRTWHTIVSLFKKLQKHFNYELLSCYRPTIIMAMLHLNDEISSAALSMLDMKDSVDDKMRQAIDDILSELEQSSVKSNQLVDEKKAKKPKLPSIKSVGSFLNRRTTSPSGFKRDINGKEITAKSKVVNIEPDSQDFVVINTDVKLDVNRLTDHQKDMLKKRREDIPAMYNELTVSNSQDTQQLQQWFDSKSSVNNNEIAVPKSASSDTLHFKNIMQAFPETQPKKIVTSPTSSPRAQTRRQSAAAAAAAATATEESLPNQQNEKSVEQSSTIVKKLDFESHDEYPVVDGDNTPAEQVSPSMIDQTNKMRRRSMAEENNAINSAKNNQSRLTRRSLQQPLEKTGTLRKYNSNEQLMGSKRGRKRRNSETSSEGTLDVEREKRPRKDSTNEVLHTSEESNKFIECTQEIDGKKFSKRQLNEMSRLKIDMVFKPLPNRRSVGKVGETDKKSLLKEDKPKEESNSQPVVKRRSMKGSVIIEKGTTNSAKDVENKKPETAQNKVRGLRTINAGKSEYTAAKKKHEVVPDSPQEINVEDVATQEETVDNIKESLIKSTIPESEETQESLKSSSQESDKSSQDSDIVESSQEPTVSKMDKVECFIKIAKVELTQTTAVKDEETEKESTVIPATQCGLDDSSISIIPPTVENEKPVLLQEAKRLENNNGKPVAPITLLSSPKSTPTRVIRSKAFPLQGRAAQMLGLVTKQSIAEKLAADGLKESALTDEVTIVPLPKKDKLIAKEHERVSSPGGSRQVKMFNNMNNNSVPQRCSSPLMSKFKNLNNDGEKVSPKLDKHESSEKESSQSSGDESPNSKSRKELPLLEWSNANPPSLTASPSASILKRNQEIDVETPNRKKRVSFADPPVSREMGYEIMTETSSPPRLEKLPSMRSPSARKEFKRQSKLRFVPMDSDTKEIEAISQPLVDDEMIPSAKIKLATVLTEISIEEVKINESTDNVKTSTQEDKNDTSIKLDSINLSNINRSSDNRQTSLDDTVDVENISSSLEMTQEKPNSIPASQGSGDDRTLPVTDSLFSNLPLSQETQNSVAHLIEPENLDSTLPVYPSLISCSDAVESLSADLVDPLFTSNLATHLSTRCIHSIGDLAQLNERDINRLPIKSPKVDCVKKALSRYEERVNTSSRTPEKSTANIVVPSSTPLGHRRPMRTRPDNDSFEDLMKTSDLMSTNVSALKKPVKRPSSDSCVQTSPTKRTRRDDEIQCLELMEQCDEDVLFDAFAKRFGADKICKGYRNNISDMLQTDRKRETLNDISLSMEDDSEANLKASMKTAGLQKILQELPNIFESDEKFIDTVLKTYKKKFKISHVLKMLKPSELKEAVPDEFSSSELLSMLVERLSREDKQLTDSSDLQALQSRVPTNVIINQVKSRADFHTEALLNFALDKCPEKPSTGVRKVLLRILTEKYEYEDLLDLTQEAQRLGWRKSSGK